MRTHAPFTATLCLLLLLCAAPLAAQKTFYGEKPVNWDDYGTAAVPETLFGREDADVVVIDDHTQFFFYGGNNEKIVRNVTYRVNSAKGLESLSTLKLPESFDRGYDELHKQGRASRIKTPFILEYTLNKLSARKFSNNRWSAVPFTLHYEKLRRVKSSGDFAGEFANEDLSVFNLQGLKAGDIVQVVYEAGFNSSYGTNQFYFNSQYPKLHCNYTFVYRVDKRFGNHAFILPLQIRDSCVQRSTLQEKDYVVVTEKIELANLTGINYPGNSFEGKKLPHVYADFRFYRVLSGSYPSDGGRVYDVDYVRPRNFEWVITRDTTNYYTKIYDKQFASIRKFVSQMPPAKIGDSTNLVFIKAMCDTFNAFRYISDNHMFYNEPNLRDVYSGDHLLRRRLVQQLQWKLYRDILNDTKLFYYIVNVQDRRLGEHSVSYRSAYAYERQLIAIPSGASYMYFMPRYDGLKYHLNELPFYLEGTLALLNPRNFQPATGKKDESFFKFIKTHKGTYNENTRSENASVRISLDSLTADLSIKESLSGQFSTLLRHLYLNEAIDSTVAAYYFKKCTDKPNVRVSKIRMTSKMSEFPFRYNFTCIARSQLSEATVFNLENWFSFPLSRMAFPELPTHTFYFDFEFSDTYNILLNFTTPVRIKNAAKFTRSISNDYFDLVSELVTQSETAHLLKVRLAVKQTSIPNQKMSLLSELLTELEALNNFSLELERN